MFILVDVDFLFILILPTGIPADSGVILFVTSHRRFILSYQFSHVCFGALGDPVQRHPVLPTQI